MNKKSYFLYLKISLFVTLLSLLISLASLYSLFNQKNEKNILAEKTSRTAFETSVSANIGVPAQFSIFGYTSSNALVTLEDLGLKEEVRANENGFFIFSNLRIPSQRKISPCLFAQDNFGRISRVICLPPIKNKPANIGPVLLPPTLSVNKSFFFTGDNIIISGQTIPNTPVALSFFKEKQTSNIFLAMVKPALAAERRQVEAYSDEKGNFTLVLKTSNAQKLKIASNTLFQNSPSPQSNLLTLKIYPWWMIIVLYFKALIATLKKHLWAIALILEIIFILFIIHKKILSPLKTEKK